MHHLMSGVEWETYKSKKGIDVSIDKRFDKDSITGKWGQRMIWGFWLNDVYDDDGSEKIYNTLRLGELAASQLAIQVIIY